jgi:hypothetical protein
LFIKIAGAHISGCIGEARRDGNEISGDEDRRKNLSLSSKTFRRKEERTNEGMAGCAGFVFRK